jgi:nucleotide-binding universal stress UspA family protein
MSAVAAGLDLAQRFNAEVTIMCILDTKAPISVQQGLGVPDLYSYQQQGADAAADAAMKLAKEKGVKAISIVKRGDPALDIIEESARHDLVIMATHGRTGVSHFLIGSVAEKVVRYASCPVMVIRSVAK